jgi:6-pyruvoyltetrahydropterin/6-carboxytetrahydropterin synthase
MEIAGSHYLKLDYPSKCENDHGHNWIITVHCKSKNLDQNGMLVDFTEIKKKIHDELDHQCLNEVLDFNPTAENMAKWICDQVKYCYRIEVQESEGNIAVYEKI